MSLYNELNSNKNVKDICGVQFSIMSPEEIFKRSVVEVNQTILYESNGDPVIGGLFDPRMGVIEHGKTCPTDNLDNRFCPGYFGHIKLSRPVFWVQFLPVVLKILKCICIKCSKLLLDVNDEIKELINKYDNKKLFTLIIEKCSKIKICGTDCENGCGAIQPTKFTKDGLSKIYAEWKDKSLDEKLTDNKQLLSAEFIIKIFSRISDIDCENMGFNPKWCRPEWLICSILPVCPPAVRPSVRQFGNQRSEDDITHKYIDILKTNNHLKRKLEVEGSLEHTIEEWTQVLQYHIATLIDNELPGINPSAHRSGRPLKTFRQRLKGKEGRIRGHLMGKRVDYSARSVITPDPNIKIGELGVPKKIAMNLTFPEIVTPYNKDLLYTYVKNGPLVHPGAKSIKKKIDNKTISLQYVDTYNIILNEGDIVNRHLIDGDTVLFNRQPSLHKMSMMGHKVRVMDFNTFRLNTSVTKPYNADFDGDEMNMHVPQSLQTSVELQYLTAVPLQIISPREHKPVISLVQDTLLGLNRITDDNIYLNKVEMMNILTYINGFDGVLPEPELKKPYERWTGRQLISIVLPKDLNLNMKNNSHDESFDDKLNHVIIENGILKQGKLDTKIMNSGTRGLIHVVFNDYGYKTCEQLLDDLQNIVTRFLIISGFSVGIGDLVANTETNDKINSTILNNKKDVSELNTQVHQQIFENNYSNSIEEEFEKKVNNLLNKAISEAGKIGLKSLDKSNRMTNMVSAGSKGKSINIAQMIACLGQQNVDGKRIPNSYNNRSLPHFPKYDISPEGKGFVESSFIQGLKPHEFFFHAMGGREGLIDTAVKTSETGYIQRKLIKAMEDLKISYDLSVRNANGSIIQFLYGEDGMDYNKIINQNMILIGCTYDKLIDKFKFDDKDNFKNYLNSSVISELKSTPNYRELLNDHFEKIVEYYHLINNYIFKNGNDNVIRFPINLYRLIDKVKLQFSIKSLLASNLNPLYIIEKLNLLEKTVKGSSNNGTQLFIILVNEYLSPKRVLKEYRLNKIAFDYLIEYILLEYNNSKVHISEMVGPIAAQSIGEPATQMTLNTFHFAGVSSKSNVTRGVPRLKELLHISKNIKSPSTTIFLDKDIKYDKVKSNEVLNKIELTTSDDIIKNISIYYDPDDENTLIDEDKAMLKIYKIYNELDPSYNSDTGSKWIIRFEFDKQKMINKNINMENIYHKINNVYGDDLNCVYSDDNSNNLIFRIRILKFKKSDNKLNDLNTLKQLAHNLSENIIIKGIDNIRNVSMFKNKNNVEIEDNSYVQKEEWVLNTTGINLLDIFSVPNVDFTRTYSNDIYEIYDILGIEAARLVLMEEIKEVIESSGNYVNFRHLSLLCDIMTNKGTLMSIDRFGINRGNIGPLAKCSFEETTDQLFKASIFGELDKLDGVSSNIMMGQIPPCGTGDTNILLDDTKLLNMEAEEELELDDMDNWTGDNYCSDNIGINFSDTGLTADNTDNIPMPEITI